MDRSPATLAIWAIVAGIAVFAGVRMFGGGGSTEPVRFAGGGTAVRSEGGGGGGALGGGAGGGAPALVHVAGAVRRPGLYRVGGQARVATAVQRAGGALPRGDLNAVNLAARVQDGQQIVVPRRGEAGASGEEGAAGTVKPSLGSATAEQLDGLDGIGPTLAARIVEYRTSHGGFRSLDQLADVEGIGEKRLAALKDSLQP